MLVVGSLTCIRTVSQKYLSIRLYPILVTWWSSTKHSRSHLPSKIVDQTGVCLGYDTRIAGGVLVVSVINGELKEVCSAKVRKLGERVGQAWRLHVHPQDATRSAYVNRKGEVKWNLQDLEVPTVEQCVKEDALEVQDIRELGLGWAWYVNDLRTFLPAWQDMELATPSSEEPLTQVAGDVPVEHFQSKLMQRSWQWKCIRMSNLWPLRLLGRRNMFPIGMKVML